MNIKEKWIELSGGSFIVMSDTIRVKMNQEIDQSTSMISVAWTQAVDDAWREARHGGWECCNGVLLGNVSTKSSINGDILKVVRTDFSALANGI